MRACVCGRTCVRVCVRKCAYVKMCVFVYASACGPVCVGLRVRVCVRLRVRVHACGRVRVRMCLCVRDRVHVRASVLTRVRTCEGAHVGVVPQMLPPTHDVERLRTTMVDFYSFINKISFHGSRRFIFTGSCSATHGLLLI